MYLCQLKMESQINQRTDLFFGSLKTYSQIPLLKCKAWLHFFLFLFIYFAVHRLCLASVSKCITLLAMTWAGTALRPVPWFQPRWGSQHTEVRLVLRAGPLGGKSHRHDGVGQGVATLPAGLCCTQAAGWTWLHFNMSLFGTPKLQLLRSEESST